MCTKRNIEILFTVRDWLIFAGMVDKIISTLSSIESIKVTTHVTVPLSPDFVTNKSTVVSEVETLNTGKIKINRMHVTNRLEFEIFFSATKIAYLIFLLVCYIMILA